MSQNRGPLTDPAVAGGDIGGAHAHSAWGWGVNRKKKKKKNFRVTKSHRRRGGGTRAGRARGLPGSRRFPPRLAPSRGRFAPRP